MPTGNKTVLNPASTPIAYHIIFGESPHPSYKLWLQTHMGVWKIFPDEQDHRGATYNLLTPTHAIRIPKTAETPPRHMVVREKWTRQPPVTSRGPYNEKMYYTSIVGWRVINFDSMIANLVPSPSPTVTKFSACASSTCTRIRIIYCFFVKAPLVSNYHWSVPWSVQITDSARFKFISRPILTEDGWIGRAQFIPRKCLVWRYISPES